MTDASEDLGFQHLVFDLDDTLLDTYRQLLSRASRDACTAMIEAGLNTDLESSLAACLEREKNLPRHNLFESLFERFGARDHAKSSELQVEATKSRIVEAGYEAFYHRKVEEDIELFDGARDMLESLKEKYSLHMVTAGNQSTQEAKIRILKIREFFSSIHHIDPSRNEKKESAFARIVQSTGCPPHLHLSIGNRVDTDVGEAKLVGMRTCWVRYGEYNHMQPTHDYEHPDFVIDHIKELPQVCRL